MTEQKGYAIPLSSSAIEVLRGLFIHVPLWDGDVPSKCGRDELVKFGLAIRYNGWQQLTRTGLELAVLNGLERSKERHYRDVRIALDVYHALRPIFEPQVINTCSSSKMMAEENIKTPTEDE